MHIASLVVAIFGTLFVAVAILLTVLIILALIKYTRSRNTHDPDPDGPGGEAFHTPEEEIKKRPLGEILKDLRTENNMTQEYVAESLGITRQAVSKWETGESSPNMANLAALAKLYNIPLEDMLKGMDI